jgi:hypothetical protein
VQSGSSVDVVYRSEVSSVAVVSVGVKVPVGVISGVLGEVVRKNVIGYSLLVSVLTTVVTCSCSVTFCEGTSVVTVVTGYGRGETVDWGVNGCSDRGCSVLNACSVDVGGADVDVSDLKVVSSLVTTKGISEDKPTVAIEVLDFSGKGVEADTSVTLEYSVSTSGVEVLSAGLLTVVSDDVGGVLLSVSKGHVTVSVMMVAFSTVGVDTASEVVKVKMEDDVEGISVDVVSVKLEGVVSVAYVVTISPNDVVNLEDKEVEVDVKCEYISSEAVSDVDGDVGEEGTMYVVT